MHNCKNLVSDLNIIDFLNKEKDKNIKDVNNIYIWEWIIYGFGGKDSKKTEILAPYIFDFDYSLWSYDDIKTIFQYLLIYGSNINLLNFQEKTKDFFDFKISNETINKTLLNKNYSLITSLEKNILLQNSKIIDDEQNPLFFSFSNLFKSNKKYGLLDYIKEVQEFLILDLNKIILPINNFLQYGEKIINDYNLFPDDSLLTILFKIKDKETNNLNAFPKQDVINDIIKLNELNILNKKLNDFPCNIKQKNKKQKI